MISLSTICSAWNESERPRPLATFLSCGCEHLISEQRRLQVLEAEGELRRLRDRVRKAVAKLSAVSQPALTVKQTHTSPRPAACSEESNELPLPRIDWQVTAEQLVERLCFWSHGSALGRVGLTDCLKESGARRIDPPASKRRLTLVGWDLEHVIRRALFYCRPWPGEPMPPPLEAIRVCVSDILPVYEWEVDCLRDRPRTRAHCGRMIRLERRDYQRYCGELSADELEWDEENEVFLCTGLNGVTWRPRQKRAADAQESSLSESDVESGGCRGHFPTRLINYELEESDVSMTKFHAATAASSTRALPHGAASLSTPTAEPSLRAAPPTQRRGFLHDHSLITPNESAVEDVSWLSQHG